MSDGPYPRYTLIYCRCDEFGLAKVAAFPDDAQAADHALTRLRRAPPEWTSVVVGRGVDAEIEFIGSWERDDVGGLRWETASLA